MFVCIIAEIIINKNTFTLYIYFVLLKSSNKDIKLPYYSRVINISACIYIHIYEVYVRRFNLSVILKITCHHKLKFITNI